jgi:hypothetical protein
MNGIAAVAERQDRSFFSFGGRELRPTEIALREHRAELGKAAALVEAAEAAAANMRATLHAAESTAETARAAIVDRQAEALAAAVPAQRKSPAPRRGESYPIWRWDARGGRVS